MWRFSREALGVSSREGGRRLLVVIKSDKRKNDKSSKVGRTLPRLLIANKEKRSRESYGKD